MVFYVYNTNRAYTAKIANTLGVLQVKILWLIRGCIICIFPLYLVIAIPW